MTATEIFEIVYCPSHLGIHRSEWCTTENHIGLGTTDETRAHNEARRRGYTFFHGDVVNFRDSADEPKAGDIVGDKRSVMGRRYFHKAYLREVVTADDERVSWVRPGKTLVYVCSRKTWKRWARGGWRCTPKGVPTRRRFWG